ncbi:hypothetical protein HK105_204358 [Polyrhizophydium stewartii]|uniref:Stress-response A/B barrel domain-containing protein n=1 Tax=Polyrhizophydium stewartii TaxID=2732419 RepID=A0ABR4N8V4_9FUNG
MAQLRAGRRAVLVLAVAAVALALALLAVAAVVPAVLLEALPLFVPADTAWRSYAVPPHELCLDCFREPHPAVPRIIHQTWKTDDIPAKWIKARGSCRYWHNRANWTHMHWTDASARAFIAHKFPEFLPTFDSYPYPIQRVDAVRYFILYEYGGVYLDLDIGCFRSMEPLLKFSAVIPKTSPIGFSNDFMMARPRHPFFKQLILALPKWNRSFLTPYATIFFSTGPMFLNLQFGLYVNSALGAEAARTQADNRTAMHNGDAARSTAGAARVKRDTQYTSKSLASQMLAASRASEPMLLDGEPSPEHNAVWVLEPRMYSGNINESYFAHFEGNSWHTSDAVVIMAAWGVLSRPWLLLLLVFAAVLVVDAGLGRSRNTTVSALHAPDPPAGAPWSDTHSLVLAPHVHADMPVKHMVLFKFRADTPADQLKALSDAFHGLVRVPGVLSVDFGETFTTERSQGFTHVLVVDLVDRAALPVYAQHPLHVDAVVTHVQPLAPESILAVDIDDPAPTRANL